jgi:hypothetical protein
MYFAYATTKRNHYRRCLHLVLEKLGSAQGLAKNRFEGENSTSPLSSVGHCLLSEIAKNPRSIFGF